MELEQRIKVLPWGDVTEQEGYQDLVTGHVRRIFSKGVSEKIRNKEKDVIIKRIVNSPYTYVAAETFFEKRNIINCCEPNNTLKATAERIRDKSEYNPWEIDCAEPKQLFGSEQYDILIGDSVYVEECTTCSTRGLVSCECTYSSNRAGAGREICFDCNGYGEFNCNNCGGSGVVQCGWCYGSGKLIKNEIIGYDDNNLPIWGDKEYACTNCGGHGQLRCGTCGGSGRLMCNTCNGTGSIVCRKCNGIKEVTCHSCNGMGYFAHAVVIEQDYDVDTVIHTLNDYGVEPSAYGGQKFADFERNENDTLIVEQQSDTPIPEFAIEKYVPNLCKTPLATEGMMKKLQEMVPIDGSKKVLKYRVQMYQRNVLDVEYEFQGQPYRMIVDDSTGQVLMNKNPYESIAEDALKDIEECCKNAKFKSFLAECEEFCTITDSEDVHYGAEDLKKYKRKMDMKCIPPIVIAAIITRIIISLPIGKFPRWFRVYRDSTRILTLVIGILIAGYFGIKNWKKFASDNKVVTYGVLSAMAVAAVVVVSFIIQIIGL